ncbi:hypothetical protein AAFF_G00008480 [Aldrovandia affinis]|uniref:Uncharacterized protein n=1 Tax=Aldrovandia affinis TaxID=143900 RepID=A0AAD7T6C4_9TELE|nr:hypothetical protein AAFF_G00008480 [Aldrovandia affinis]
MRMDAIGLLWEVSKPAFVFIRSSYLVQKVRMLLDAPNKLLQGEDTDLLTGLELVVSATECVSKLCCETKFTELWNRVTDANDTTPAPSKRRRKKNEHGPVCG